MANVFLSYDREDIGRAKPIAGILENAGHSVWWDWHIKGGAQYSKEIEEALKRAEAIVVLWSEHAVESAWVRDEAATGRDSGRLIPVLLDGTQPPLGFRQYQAIDLSRWKNRGSAGLIKPLLDAVDGLRRREPTTDAAPAPAPPARPQIGVSRRPLLIALIVAAILGAGAVAWKLIMMKPSAPVVAVETAEPSPFAKAFARDLLVKLGSLQAAHTDAIKLVKGGSGQKADLVFEVGGSREGQQSNANLVLLAGKDRALLWSKDFKQPSGQEADLKQQLAFTAARVLGCAIEGLQAEGKRLSQQTLKLYLNGCATLSETSGSDTAVVVPLFLQITQKAPDFAGGWAKLLVAETDMYLSGSENMRGRLREHIAKARQVSPDMAEAYQAEIDLLPWNAYDRRMALADKAVSLNPDEALPLSTRAGVLAEIGRMNEAVDDSLRAVELDPLSPTIREGYISSLTYAGRTDTALSELRKAERLWPGASILDQMRFGINLRYGDAAEALRFIRSGALGAQWTTAESYLEARIDPTPANVDRAVEQILRRYRREPYAISTLVQVLGQFHREEQLQRLLLDAPKADVISAMDVMFRPALADFWRDPRSLRVADRAGLLDYWRRSGIWPDFCNWSDLPYNCKEEAAKISA